MSVIEKTVRLRSRPHLEFVASKPCLICKTTPVQAHHLTIAQPKGRGLRAGDNWTVPLCYAHHQELHMTGNERNFWQKYKINGIKAAEWFWAQSEVNRK